MTVQWSSIHLMFCEGPHDASFLHRLLKTQLGFLTVKPKLSDLPYPISNVLQQSFRTRVADDLRLDLAKKFFLPDYLVVLDATLVMIFNYGGSNRRASMSPFLEAVFTLLGAPAFAGAAKPQFTYTVFTDADDLGIVRALEEIRVDLATIGGLGWLESAWKEVGGTSAFTQGSAFGPTAAYIWKKWAEDNGTLEDVILECLSGDAGLQQTRAFLNARFSWQPAAGATPKEICAAKARHLKAAFCVEGQHRKPGGSLGVVLDQTDLLKPEAMKTSAAIQDCVAFLSNWVKPVSHDAAASVDAASLPDSPLVVQGDGDV